MWAGLCYPLVHRERAEKRQQNKNKRGDGRERTCRNRSNTRLVAKRRKIVNARQTHHLPP